MQSCAGVVHYSDKPSIKVLRNGVWLKAVLLGTLDGRAAVEIPALGRGGVQYLPIANVRGIPVK